MFLVHKKETFTRDYCYCSKCKIGVYPLDKFLGIQKKNYSPALMKLIGHFTAISTSFKDAEKLFKHANLCPVSTTYVMRVANKLGKSGIDEEDKILEKTKSYALELGKRNINDIFAVLLDGGRCLIDMIGLPPVWKEVKLGAFVNYHSTRNKEGEKVLSRESTNYIGRIDEKSEIFGDRLWKEALRHGYNNSKLKVFLGDGAPYNWRIQEAYFSDAIAILDWYHCMEHLVNAAKLIFGEDKKNYIEWYEKHKTNIYNGETQKTIDDILLETTKILNSDLRQKVVLEATYFKNNIARMNYKYFESLGLPIGSGVIEGGIKQLVNRRIKGTEKHWLVKNGNNILRLRIAEATDSMVNLVELEKKVA